MLFASLSVVLQGSLVKALVIVGMYVQYGKKAVSLIRNIPNEWIYGPIVINSLACNKFHPGFPSSCWKKYVLHVYMVIYIWSGF